MITFVIITALVANSSSSRVIKLHFPLNLCVLRGKLEGIYCSEINKAKVGLWVN